MCRTPVFGGTSEEYLVKCFGWPIRLWNKCRKAHTQAKKLNTATKDLKALLSDQKTLKLAQQYLKVFVVIISVYSFPVIICYNMQTEWQRLTYA